MKDRLPICPPPHANGSLVISYADPYPPDDSQPATAAIIWWGGHDWPMTVRGLGSCWLIEFANLTVEDIRPSFREAITTAHSIAWRCGQELVMATRDGGC